MVSHCAISHFAQCSTTGVIKVMCGMVHVKDPLLLIGKGSPLSCSSGFPVSVVIYHMLNTRFLKEAIVHSSASVTKLSPSLT